MGKEKLACRLYLISPPRIELAAFAKSLEDAFSGGDIGAFQLRLKDVSDDEILKATETLLPIVHAHDAAFILNDRPDLAHQINADGVHLGQEDLKTMPIAKARGILGNDAIIGVSCHASKHMAMEAGEQGADYVAFGAFYPTQSKEAEKLKQYGTPTPEILTWWQECFILPCAAIGGITPGNCAALVKAGADFIAAITSVWSHEKGPGRAVKEFNDAIKKVMDEQSED